MTAQQALQTYFGYDAFRPMQAEIIESVLAGNDTLALLPTGGGKSLCFQVPTMVMAEDAGEGLCLVVTPLIALMKDQVTNLRERGILATAIYTGMSREEQRTALDNCLYGPYRFLYVSPERLESEEFLRRVTQLPVCLIAVDEAHCISQWGYDFRPSYLRIAEIRNILDVPVLALTATATPDVVEDIQQQLGFREPNVFRTSFARPNLHYVVRRTDDKPGQLLRILQRVPGSAIVYVRNRKRTRELSDWLNEQFVNQSPIVNQSSIVNYYHAGLPASERHAKQQAWKDGQTRIIVCTNAFGMGIDKPDVRLVIHYDLPDSIEAYFQEAGRAGRDGQQAWCVLLYSERDKAVVRQRIPNNYPPVEEIERVYQLLCDYLTIGLGSGRDATFTLDVEQFCTDMHLPFLTTYAALQLLTTAGYISYNDEQDLQPRVRILLDKEDLYHIDESPFQERLLSALMRRYTGIFTEAQFIHLPRLAEDLGSTEFAVNSSLIALSKQHIIRYIPAQRVSIVHFPVPRQAQVNLSARVYADRREVFTRKLQAMLEYADNNHYCRSQLMLGYFGEPDAPLCNSCDICLANKHNAVDYPQHHRQPAEPKKSSHQHQKS
ncbi:MAG: RecQ family ATP-dependent DNA helicase [Paludibacteraceae bacterium]|nr:RecQ family ATP-dependent DNA helicase [Paludibacteraceae bacterium]